MRNFNSILIINLLFFVSSMYGQKGFYVDKDYRIEKYQKEIIKVFKNLGQLYWNDLILNYC